MQVLIASLNIKSKYIAFPSLDSRQTRYSIAFASLLLPALCAGCVNSEKAKSPVRIAIKRFLKLFIAKRYFFLGATATPHVFPAFLSPILADLARFKSRLDVLARLCPIRG